MRRLTNDTILKLSSAINISSGAAKLFSLAMIQQKSNPYVRDDTIFIKIMVDIGDMSQTPIHIQQLLIEKEVMLLQQSIETDFDKDHYNGQQSST
ncbi:unnamed protein product [Rotaria magnacalcarata]|uniref:Uncharacterized protein n=2 Tax=Rotaria magnacalcarata TaxID=392030 RepID=A0A820E9Y9_9BILA|nr:unnamed protein product [Rotaria magnacalcarata]CAF4243648.1 unnamed protein product [Rotaria magnacalcarata]